MMLLDTSVLIRHLTGEPPDLAERATQLLTGEEALLLTDVVAAETLWVLGSVHRLPRATAATMLRTLIGAAGVVCDDAPALIRVLDLHEQGASVIDAYLVARAERDALPIATFDRGLGRGTDVVRIEP